MESKIIRISLASVLLYLISNRLYRILSQIILWLGIEFKVSNQLVHTSLYLLVSTVLLFCLFRLYTIFLKNKIPSIQTILILLTISVLLSLLSMFGNYLLGKFGAEHQLNYTEYVSLYMSLYSLETLFAGIYPILALLFLLWKLYSIKKTKVK